MDEAKCKGVHIQDKTNRAVKIFAGIENDSDWPAGCYYCHGVKGCSDGVWYNQNRTGSANALEVAGVRSYCEYTGK